MEIPARNYSFDQLRGAQAIGDFTALRRRHRRIVRINLCGDVGKGLALVQRSGADRAQESNIIVIDVEAAHGIIHAIHAVVLPNAQ